MSTRRRFWNKCEQCGDFTRFGITKFVLQPPDANGKWYRFDTAAPVKHMCHTCHPVISMKEAATRLSQQTSSSSSSSSLLEYSDYFTIVYMFRTDCGISIGLEHRGDSDADHEEAMAGLIDATMLYADDKNHARRVDAVASRTRSSRLA